MAVKLSKPSKMPCKSWSLQAFDDCPGKVMVDGSIAPACDGCYARGGFYGMPDAIAVRSHNREDWKREDWVPDMVSAIGKADYFRWFDSGDMYSVRLAEKIYQVMRHTPNCRHWLPTRMHKFAKFRPVIDRMQRLPNVVVRRSSDSITGETVRGISSTIIPAPEHADSRHSFVCGAYQRDGKCGECRACWDSSNRVIAYPAHGGRMAKVIRLKEIR